MKKVRSKLRPTEIGVIKTFSLSPDDEVGEIAVECTGCTYYYNNLTELCEKWEDYEEPNRIVKVEKSIVPNCVCIECTTEEEAERVVEKLKAWERLKDTGFRFTGFEETDRGCLGDFTIYCYIEPDRTRPYEDVEDDLDLLFGGEE